MLCPLATQVIVLLITPCNLLVHIHAQRPQLLLCHLDLPHYLLVRVGAVVEGEDAPAEADEEVCAEGNEEPEGQLFEFGT